MCKLIASHISKGDDIVKIICLNTWDVGDLSLFEYDELGNDIGYSGAKIMRGISHGKEECQWSIRSNTGRHNCEITITYGEKSALDLCELAEQICQECLDQVWNGAFKNKIRNKKTYHCDVLLDSSNNKVYPISPDVTGYYIQNFWVHIDHHNENKMDAVYVVYNPE